jgi:transcriptional regulator with XRE-family HTH domain
MISVYQIKAGRVMLGWSAVELAERAGVSSATIKKYEAQTGIPNANTRILSAVKSILESAGIEFTGDPLVNPGVTLLIKRDN